MKKFCKKKKLNALTHNDDKPPTFTTYNNKCWSGLINLVHISYTQHGKSVKIDVYNQFSIIFTRSSFARNKLQ
jgi:hypothetical protein